jgi:hypothetical protein
MAYVCYAKRAASVLLWRWATEGGRARDFRLAHSPCNERGSLCRWQDLLRPALPANDPTSPGPALRDLTSAALLSRICPHLQYPPRALIYPSARRLSRARHHHRRPVSDPGLNRPNPLCCSHRRPPPLPITRTTVPIGPHGARDPAETPPLGVSLLIQVPPDPSGVNRAKPCLTSLRPSSLHRSTDTEHVPRSGYLKLFCERVG